MGKTAWNLGWVGCDWPLHDIKDNVLDQHMVDNDRGQGNERLAEPSTAPQAELQRTTPK